MKEKRECLEFIGSQEFKAIDILEAVKENHYVIFLDDTVDEAITELKNLTKQKDRLVLKERDGISVLLEIIEYFRAEQIVNNNTPFNESDYDFGINTLKETVKLCNIRGELCKIYGAKFEEIKTLGEI